MTDPGIKSKPLYPGLTPDPDARQHILVGEGAGGDALLRIGASLADGMAAPDRDAWPLVLFYTVGPGPDRVDALGGFVTGAAHVYPNAEQLRSAMHGTLVDAPMGARLYLAGTEPFLWTVALAAREAGMPDTAIQMERCGPAIRPVSCVHCKTTAPTVDKTIYQCPGCGLHLMVRDHFSRRLGVYQGVCVDAEAPGQVPEAEELEP